jgi:hypothetical protein
MVSTLLPVRACLCVYARRQVRTQTGKYPGFPPGSGLHLSPYCSSFCLLGLLIEGDTALIGHCFLQIVDMGYRDVRYIPVFFFSIFIRHAL